jgi:hypothetical protein
MEVVSSKVGSTIAASYVESSFGSVVNFSEIIV